MWTDYIFWLVMALTFVWYMWDGGVQAIHEWWDVRVFRKQLKEYENEHGTSEEDRDLPHL